MRGLTVGLVVLFLLFAHAAAAEENRQADYQAFVSGTIQVTKEGTVSAYALKEEVKPAVRTLLDKNIRSWRFEPILVDGYPVVATTSMALRLVAVPMANKQYALSIAEARFGDPDQSDTVVPPPYPPDALRAAREAEVMLILQLDPQGRVLNVHAEQTSLNIPPDDRTAAYWRDRFEKTSISPPDYGSSTSPKKSMAVPSAEAYAFPSNTPCMRGASTYQAPSVLLRGYRLE
ncbi:MAG: hypothetical protein ABWY94_12290 [Pseudoxanthomonas sp.]